MLLNGKHLIISLTESQLKWINACLPKDHPLKNESGELEVVKELESGVIDGDINKME